MRTRPHPTPRTARRTTRRAIASTAVAALAISLLGISAPLAAHAAAVPAPTAHYDMSANGSTLLDVSGNGRNATLTGLTANSFVNVAGDSVLRFNGDGYASLPQGLVTGTDNSFTVEYTVTTQTARNQFGWVIGNGVGAWNTTQLGNHVFVNPRSSDAPSGRVLAGIRVYDGGNGETRLPAGGSLNPGLTTLTLVGNGNALTLYRDGAQISTVTHTKLMSAIVPATGVLGYLGRSLYTGDALVKADVSDVKFWDVALTPQEVTDSMPTAAQKAATTDGIIRLDIQSTVRGSNPSLDSVTKNLVFPASANGITLTWASSNPAVVSNTGVVSRSTLTADAPVTITATTSLGTTITFDVVVKAPVLAADLDAITLTTRTTENLPLITTGSVNGAPITWASSDAALVTPTNSSYTAPAVGAPDPFKGGGLIERPAYGAGDKSVTLTATATLNGATTSRSFTVAVAEKARWAPDAGYAAAYFKADNDEKIYQAATAGNDFFSFAPVNGGAPTIVSTADTTGLRDPYVIRSAEGDKYYMIATDLCIGCTGDWGAAQSNGSLKIEVWESTDMKSWVRTNGQNAGITINQPEAGMTWAPEAYWDDDLQSYVVFFASRLYNDVAHTSGPGHARMFYVLTRDFKTFTYPPTTWQDTGYARIDSTVTKIDDYYYRFTKNEDGGAAGTLEAGKDIFLERSKVLTAPTTQSSWTADPGTTWQLTDTNMTRLETNQVGEGPEIVKLNAGDPNNTAEGDGYVFLVDNYGAGGYRAFLTDADAIASSTQSDRLSKRAEWVVRPQGGLPASPRHGSFVSVTKSVLTALNTWSAVAAVSSTTALSAEGRVATAEVTASDGGDVVGTVTFSGGAWSETVDLEDGSASVTVPAGAGSVTAHYDGYTDGLVSPSTSAAVSFALELSASATTRCVAGKVTEVVSVTNADAVAATVTIAGTYGSKTVAVAPGKTVSATFATRATSVSAHTVAITGQSADGRSHSSSAAIAAATCQ
ncbi:immunoglobulin-like domain-containing protein [Microbacterium sp. CFBP9034]|uniref:immunoglobulin-like domain-containing protein n=1 Tax=Microbacterium sp. CFBP9034 TaxID=3096540 RepID=UPI002A69FBCC|nr:immunoglobulin-like domain-containing protein [Microbacterium sp. CFBP9034]MDY0908626.1 immunoglobulin-like domain-containing protein [Microbacterium sp. CFBP9034]